MPGEGRGKGKGQVMRRDEEKGQKERREKFSAESFVGKWEGEGK